MKIQIVKKADKKTAPAQCAWFVEGLPEPRK
jgi:hypothetical protein